MGTPLPSESLGEGHQCVVSGVEVTPPPEQRWSWTSSKTTSDDVVVTLANRKITNMVNKERVWLWIEALRSGKFEQARDTLREGNKYCCLGVACEVAIRNGLELRQDGLHSYSYDGKFSNLGTLPQSVVDWYGLPAASPQLGQFSATDRNDKRKESFDEIAAHIEKEYFNEDS